ncbi:hypothetical protein N7478_012872 [Penicillium angulare]|uniref:uncharacterized protein n=1 Tax=Penicillium angulare TaxID=116970 RepID=UPI002541E114|nr:uncharacterized protein N7478_012872 [Penicillium angulare]KAJ5256768.1 hypothetical protein N7478_012872 [Penicillium angulare]
MQEQSSSPQCHLEPVDLNDASQFNEIRDQRIICGWESDIQTLRGWQDKADLKRLFWIIIPDNSTHAEKTFIHAGHISLDASSNLLDESGISSGETELSINSVFIMPDYRSLGLGKRAVKLVETMAVTEPYGDSNCRCLTLTALSKRYFYDDAPEWSGLWEKIGMERPSFSIQEWYEKLGYVSWKVEPLYEEKTLDGETVMIWEAFMKKDLRRDSMRVDGSLYNHTSWGSS